MRLPIAIAAACACLAAASAHAECRAVGVSGVTHFPGEIGHRFEALRAQDSNVDSIGKVKLWRALLAAGEADPATPPELLARAHDALAWTLGSADPDVSHALAEANAAQAILARVGLSDAPVAAPMLARLAIIEASAGKGDPKARLDAARPLVVKGFGEVSAERAVVASGDAYVAYLAGDFDASTRHYALAADLYRRCLDASDSNITEMMSSYAGSLDALGRQEEALGVNEQSVAWAMRHLPPNSESTNLALNNLATSLRNVNRLAEAEAIFRELLNRQQRYQPTLWVMRATTLQNYATTIDTQGRHDEAETLWLQSRAWFAKAPGNPDTVGPSYPLRFAAVAAASRGDVALALTRQEEAVKGIAAGVPADHPYLAIARIELADLMRLHGRDTEALAMANAAIAFVRAKLAEDSVRRMGTEVRYARVVAAAEGADKGYPIAAAVAARLEAKLLDTSTSSTELIRYGATYAPAFATVVELSLATGRQEEAFRALQLANLSEIVLVTSDVAARAASADPRARALVAELQDRVREGRALDRRRSFAAGAGAAGKNDGKAEEAIAANRARIVALEAELDRVFPAFRQLGRPTPVSLATFRARLRPAEVLLAPLPLDNGTLAIAVTREGLTWSKTPIPAAAVTRLAGRIRGTIDNFDRDGAGVFDVGAASELHDAIIPVALAPTIATHPSLLYLANGALATVPPALLVTRPSLAGTPLAQVPWLIRTHEVTVLPTLAAAAVAVVMAAPRAQAFLGVGAPALAPPARLASRGMALRDGVVAGGSVVRLPALPGALTELRAMRTALSGPDSRLVTGKTATEAAIKALPLRHYSVIAFATHGLAPGDAPRLTEPALVLTPPARVNGDDDGLLKASEIAALKLDADWVILSACNSAGAAETGSAPYGGLASAFVGAGARALLVSHWPVRDDAAERLTVATVRNTRAGMTRAAALRAAMLAMIAKPGMAHPALWAPFVLIDR